MTLQGHQMGGGVYVLKNLSYNPESEMFMDSVNYNSNDADLLNNIPVLTSTNTGL